VKDFYWNFISKNLIFIDKLKSMSNLSQQILQRTAVLPPEMQLEVLHFVEFLLQRVKKEPIAELPATNFSFIGKGSSSGNINQIENLRDFAYED